MTKSELIDTLNKLNIPKSAYSIDSDKNEALCLMREGVLWVVFYSERGQKTEPKYLGSEDDAYDVFFERLKHMLGM